PTFSFKDFLLALPRFTPPKTAFIGQDTGQVAERIKYLELPLALERKEALHRHHHHSEGQGGASLWLEPGSTEIEKQQYAQLKQILIQWMEQISQFLQVVESSVINTTHNSQRRTMTCVHIPKEAYETGNPNRNLRNSDNELQEGRECDWGYKWAPIAGDFGWVKRDHDDDDEDDGDDEDDDDEDEQEGT
ncbi:hypothetical protein J0S82_019393, partial [Galemys pyrenaicus]